MAAWLAAGFIITAAAAAKAQTEIGLSDEFAGPGLDQSIWMTRQIPQSRYRLDEGSLEITALAADTGCIGDPIPCQRSEIRVREERQIPFGTDAWYGFSFRVDGYVDPDDSNRLVIGQWKEQSDGSPFIAQRFDNRIFRITVQDSECRAIIAETPSDLGLMHGLLFLASHVMKCTRAPKIRLTPPNPALHILPDPYGGNVHFNKALTA